MGTKPQPAPETLVVDEAKKFQLDALKAIRESAFQRWQQRRTYEWQLSISIWTALAAFSGLVISGKQPIHDGKKFAVAAAIIGMLITAIHLFYFWMMSTHLIGDVHVQRITEQEIWALAFPDGKGMPWRSKTSHETAGSVLKPPEEKELVCHPPLSRYGIAQVLITFVLALSAATTVWTVGQTQPSAGSTQTASK